MIDADELTLIRGSLTHALETVDAPAIPGALLELGWAELLATDPAAVVPVTAEEQGRLRTPTPVLDLVALAAAGLPVTADVALVLPAPTRAGLHSATTSDDGLHVDGVALAGHGRAETCVVLATDGLWQVPAAALEHVPLAGGDPDVGLARRRGRVPSDEATRVGGPDEAASVLAAGRRFLSSELLGLADHMLTGARDYVLARQQFGHPIGAFQAVKHRLADVHVAIAAGRAGVTTAWSDRSPTSAMAAKCLAGRAHAVAAAQCHQVQGGMAFTAEHGFHRSIRRGQVLDALLGTSRDLTRSLGRQLLADRVVPRAPTVSG